jgi:hypothetical protein
MTVEDQKASESDSLRMARNQAARGANARRWQARSDAMIASA